MRRLWSLPVPFNLSSGFCVMGTPGLPLKAGAKSCPSLAEFIDDLTFYRFFCLSAALPIHHQVGPDKLTALLSEAGHRVNFEKWGGQKSRLRTSLSENKESKSIGSPGTPLALNISSFTQLANFFGEIDVLIQTSEYSISALGQSKFVPRQVSFSDFKNFAKNSGTRVVLFVSSESPTKITWMTPVTVSGYSSR